MEKDSIEFGSIGFVDGGIGFVALELHRILNVAGKAPTWARTRRENLELEPLPHHRLERDLPRSPRGNDAGKLPLQLRRADAVFGRREDRSGSRCRGGTGVVSSFSPKNETTPITLWYAWPVSSSPYRLLAESVTCGSIADWKPPMALPWARPVTRMPSPPLGSADWIDVSVQAAVSVTCTPVASPPISMPLPRLLKTIESCM